MNTESAATWFSTARQAIDSPGLPPSLKPFHWEELRSEPASRQSDAPISNRNASVDLRIELGRTQIRRDAVEALRPGDVVPLDGAAGAPVEVYANGVLIARGEPIVLNGVFGVRVVEKMVHYH